MATAAKILGVAPASLAKVAGVAKASIKKVMGVDLPSGATVIDSYPESNSSDGYACRDGGTCERVGQAITLSSAVTITKISLYLQRVGSPAGNANVRLASVTGTVGSTAVANSTVATSDAVVMSTISDTVSLVDFTFSTPYSASTGDIAFSIVPSGGDASNYISVKHDSSTPSHGGNLFIFNGSSWVAQSGQDLIFYLYGS
jgi:hypothetical protein